MGSAQCLDFFARSAMGMMNVSFIKRYYEEAFKMPQVIRYTYPIWNQY
jgi:hypothetical protein